MLEIIPLLYHREFSYEFLRLELGVVSAKMNNKSGSIYEADLNKLEIIFDANLRFALSPCPAGWCRPRQRQIIDQILQDLW